MGKLSDNVYLIKGHTGDYKDNAENKTTSPTVYLRLRRLIEELTNSPKRDLNFKSDPCKYLEEILDIYKKLCKGLYHKGKTSTPMSILDSLLILKKKQYKTTTLSNVIVEDLINTLYGDSLMSAAKYQMINEDWTDMIYQYFISPSSKKNLSKDKVYKAIERAPILDFTVPNSTQFDVQKTTYTNEVATLLDKLGLIETVNVLEILFTKLFIFDL